MTKVKYHAVTKDEHEIFLDELFDRRKKIEMTGPKESAFDFGTINDFKSIYKYNKPSQLTRADGTEIYGLCFLILYIACFKYNESNT